MAIASISVIIPCYNGSRFLRETIESALKQTFTPLEVIVVDDGSTDDSAAIAESFGATVRVIRQANAGESSARNHGLRYAQGTHCYFLDADDLVCGSTFEQMKDAIEDPTRDVILVGHAKFRDSTSDTYDAVVPGVSEFLPAILSSNFGPPICWLVPTQLARTAGGFTESIRYFEDWDFWCQVALSGGKLKPLQLQGALYRRHSGAQTFLMKADRQDRDRERGRASRLDRAKITERAILRMLESEELTLRYGTNAFWAGCTAALAVRAEGLSWKSCESLLAAMDRMFRAAGPELRGSRIGLLAQCLGVRNALALRRLLRV